VWQRGGQGGPDHGAGGRRSSSEGDFTRAMWWRWPRLGHGLFPGRHKSRCDFAAYSVLYFADGGLVITPMPLKIGAGLLSFVGLEVRCKKVRSVARTAEASPAGLRENGHCLYRGRPGPRINSEGKCGEKFSNSAWALGEEGERERGEKGRERGLAACFLEPGGGYSCA